MRSNFRSYGLIVGYLVIMIASFWLLRHWQVVDLQKLSAKHTTFWDKIAEHEHKNRTAIIQLAGGFLVLFGLFVAWRRVKVSEDGQITERFTAAVEQLGHEKIEVQLGGIFALERISKESAKNRWTIIEVLSGFVRHNSQWLPEVHSEDTKQQAKTETLPPGENIQAILTVLGRQERPRKEQSKVSLAYTNLSRIKLQDLNFQSTNFFMANLSSASHSNTYFHSATLYGANLSNTYGYGSNFSNADLSYANLSYADLTRADFSNANLYMADLSNAILYEADLSNAILYEANLTDVHLSNTLGLTIEQLLSVKTLYLSKLPEVLKAVFENRYMEDYTRLTKKPDEKNDI